MLIEIQHRTSYHYAATANYTVQSLRLTPPSFDGQRVLSWDISAPGIGEASTFVDGYGNAVHLAAAAEPHNAIVIEARGVVETEDRVGVVRGLREAAPVRSFLRPTPSTEADDPIRDLARRALRRSNLDTLHTLMRTIREAIHYEVGATHAHTTAREALADRKGVCQDHAHVFISAARVLNIPARYVNGYFLSGTLAPSEAHHAWAEAWVEGLGWVGFDPANGTSPTERYVRLACGLDAASAAPIRGTQMGGSGETLDVTVEVQQQSAQQ